jgi:hypothetical protein
MTTAGRASSNAHTCNPEIASGVGNFPIGTPLRSATVAGQRGRVQLASASESWTNLVGLAAGPGVEGQSVQIISFGPLEATTDQWDTVTGGKGGLVTASPYYVGTTAGTLTTDVLSTPGMRVATVGIALSPTVMMVQIGYRISVEDDDAEEDEPHGPLDLSLRCDGVNVEIHLTAAKCRKTGSFLDHLAQRFLPQIVNQMAPSAARAPEAEHPSKPIPSIVDFARERLAADELSLDDMASVSKILRDEHDRRVRRAERARSPALTITDLVEDYLDHHPLEDRDLVDLIDVVTAAERRARGEPGEATS